MCEFLEFFRNLTGIQSVNRYSRDHKLSGICQGRVPLEGPDVRIVFRAQAALILLLGLFLFSSGCTPEQYAEQADEVAVSTLDEGQQAALGEKEDFDVDYQPYAVETIDGRRVIRVRDL